MSIYDDLDLFKSDTTTPSSPKLDALQIAIRKKAEALSHVSGLRNGRSDAQKDVTSRRMINSLDQDIDRNNKAWVQDHELDSVAGNVQNVVGAINSAAVRAMEGVATAPNRYMSKVINTIADDGTKTPYMKSIAAKEQQKELRDRVNRLDRGVELGFMTPEEAGGQRTTLLNQIAELNNVLSPEENAALDSVAEKEKGNLFLDPKTNRELLDMSMKDAKDESEIREWIGNNGPRHAFNNKRTGAVSGGVGAVVEEQADELDKGVEQIFNDDVLGGLDTLTEASKKIIKGSAGVIADNPMGTFDTVLESGADLTMAMVGGPLGLAALGFSSLQDAQDSGDQRLRALTAKTGEAPTAEELALNMFGELTHATVNYAGSIISAGLLKPVMKVGQKTGLKVPNAVSATAAKLQKGIDGNAVLSTLAYTGKKAAALGGTGVSEGLTGLTQGVIEQTLMSGNTDVANVDKAEAVTSGVMEAIGGLGMGAAMQAPVAATDAAIILGTAVTAPARARAAALAADVSELATNAAKAMEEGTLETYVEENKEKLAKVPQAAAIMGAQLEASLSGETSPEDIAKAKELFLRLDMGVNEDIGKQAEVLADLEAADNPNKKAISKAKTKLKELEKVAGHMEKLSANIKKRTFNKESVSKLAVELADTSRSDHEMKSSAGQLIQILNQDSHDLQLVDSAVIQEILDKNSAALDDSTKEQMSTFIVARQAVDEASDNIDTLKVRRDVLFGRTNDKSGKGKGLKQYREQFMAAIETGDTETALLKREDLRRFQENHTQKADDFAAAYESVTTGDRKGETITTTYKLHTPNKKTGQTHFEISAGSKNAVDAVRLEERALTAGIAEIDAVLKAKGIATIEGGYVSPPPPRTSAKPELVVDNPSVPKPAKLKEVTPDADQTTPAANTTARTQDKPAKGRAKYESKNKSSLPLDVYEDDFNQQGTQVAEQRKTPQEGTPAAPESTALTEQATVTPATPPVTPEAQDTASKTIEQEEDQAAQAEADRKEDTRKRRSDAAKKSKNRAVDPAKDSLRDAIARLGGLLFSDMEREGLDPSAMKGMKGGQAHPLFRKTAGLLTGRSLDDMAPALYTFGYLTADNRIDQVKELLDKLTAIVDEGKDFYAGQGLENHLESLADARADLEQEMAELEGESAAIAVDNWLADIVDRATLAGVSPVAIEYIIDNTETPDEAAVEINRLYEDIVQARQSEGTGGVAQGTEEISLDAQGTQEVDPLWDDEVGDLLTSNDLNSELLEEELGTPPELSEEERSLENSYMDQNSLSFEEMQGLNNEGLDSFNEQDVPADDTDDDASLYEPTAEEQTRDTLSAEVDALQVAINSRNIRLNDDKRLAEFAAEQGVTVDEVKSALKAANKVDRAKIKEIRKELDPLVGITNAPFGQRATTSSEADQQRIAETTKKDDNSKKPVSLQERALNLYKNSNLIAKYFKAVPSGIINRVENLISKLSTTPGIASHFTKMTVTAQHRAIMANFADFHKNVTSGVFDQLYVNNTNTRKTRHPDFIRYLADDQTGQIPEEVKVAISAAIYNWLLTEANGTQSNNAQEINRILGEDDNAMIHPEVFNSLVHAGVSENQLIERLGKEAVRFLGIKESGDAFENISGKLETSLGTYAMSIMNNADMLQYTPVSIELLSDNSDTWVYDPKLLVYIGKPTAEDYATLTPEEIETMEAQVIVRGGDAHFYRASFDTLEDGTEVLNEDIADILKLNAESNDFFGKLVDATSVSRKPSMNQPKSRPKDQPMKMDRTNQTVAREAQDNLEKYEKKRWSVAPDNFSVLNFLDDHQQLLIGGVLDGVLDVFHQANQESVEAQNVAIKNDIANLKAWVRELEAAGGKVDTPFYFNHTFWKNMRTGMVGSDVNPQASKIQRGLLRMNQWVVDARINQDGTGDSKHERMFKLGVAQSLDVSIDKKPIKDSLAELDEMLKPGVNKHGILEALAAVKVVMDPEAAAQLSPAQRAQHQAAITRTLVGFKSVTNPFLGSGSSGHALHGLVNLARYQVAKDSGKTNFKSDISIEIDGITNGPILGLVHFTGEDSQTVRDLLERGGIFFDSKESYGEFYKAGNHDSYMALGALWTDALPDVMRDPDTRKKVRNADRRVEIIGEYFEINRNNSKDPLMTKIYGAGVGSQNRTLRNTLEAYVYKKIESIVADPVMDEATKLSNLEMIADDVNTMAGHYEGTKKELALDLYDLTDSKQALDIMITRKGSSDLLWLMKDTYGAALARAIDKNFNNFIDNRTVFNNFMSTAAAIYKYKFEEAVRIRMQELIDEGVVVKNWTTLPINEMRRIEESLKEYLPILPTGFEDSLDSGITAMKTEKSQSDDPRYKVQITFHNKVNFTAAPGQEGRTPVSSIRSTFDSKEVKSPGVSPSILSIHGTDAYIANIIYGNHSVLNVHDGFFASILDAGTVGTALNQATMDVLKKHNLGAQIHKRAQRINELLGQMSPEDRATLEGVVDGTLMRWTPNNILQNAPDAVPTWVSSFEAVNETFATSQERVDTLLAAVTYMTQYNMEESGLKTGNEPTAPSVLPPEEETETLPTKVEPEPKTRPAKVRKAFVQEAQEVDPSEIEGLFTPDASGKRQLSGEVFVERLTALLKGRGAISEGSQLMLGLIKRGMADNLTINLLAQGETFTDVNGVTGSADEYQGGGFLGVFLPDDNAIYLRDGSYRTSGARLETVMHEMIHASITRLLASKQRDIMTGDAIREMKKLQKMVLKHLEDNPDADFRSSNQLDDLNEFVAWALTNRQFQELLKSIPYQGPIKAKKPWIKTAFDAVVNSLQGLIFKGTGGAHSEVAHSVLSAVIENGALLMEASATIQETGGQYDFSQSFINEMSNGQGKTMQLPGFKQAVDKMTAAEMLGALDQYDTDPRHARSEEHKAHLLNIQDSIIGPLAGVNGATLKMTEEYLGDEADQFIRNRSEGTTTFSSKLHNAFDLSHQEAYVVEQVEAVMGEMLYEQNDLTTELGRIFDVAQAALTWRDFLNPGEQNNPSAEQEQMARLRYNTLFTPTTHEVTSEWREESDKVVVSRRSQHLQRFAAMMLVNQDLRSKLAGVSAKVVNEEFRGKDIGGMMQVLWNRIINLVNRMVSPAARAKGDKITDRTSNILTKLGQVQFRNRQMILRGMETSVDTVNNTTDAVIVKGRQKIEAVGDKIKNLNTSSIIKSVGTTISIVAGGKTETALDVVMDIRNSAFQNRQLGVLAELLNEVRGRTESTSTMHDRLRFANRDIDQARSKAHDWIQAIVTEGFERELSEQESTAMTKTLLKTDLSALLEDYTIEQIMEFVDPASQRKLVAEIQDLRDQLSWYGEAAFYHNQSKALGYKMVTGEATLSDLNLNASNIAEGGATGRAFDEVEAAGAKPILEKLITLEALFYTPQNYRDDATQVLLNEHNRTDGRNGAVELLHYSRGLREQAQLDSFNNSEVNMEKGYTFEMLDPNITLMARPAAEHKDMIAMGFALVVTDGSNKPHSIGKDPHDPNQGEMFLYSRRDGGHQTYLAGSISLTSQAMRGTSITNAAITGNTDGGFTMSQKLINDQWAANQSNRDMQMKNSSFDPLKAKKSYLVPTMDSTGAVHDYRYIMSEATKDTVGKKINDVGKVMGAQAGNLVDKAATPANNAKVIDALKDMYDNDLERNGTDGYLTISASSSDKRLREIWHQLPYAAKQKAKEAFGQPVLMVRNDVLNMTAGYRKKSMANIWSIDDEDRTMMQDAFVWTMEKMFKQKASSRVKAGGDMVVELVKMVKDIYVIKNFFTLFSNEVSNTAFLSASGVPTQDIVKGKKEAYVYALRYQKFERELFKIKSRLGTGLVTGSELVKLRGEVAKLENELTNNPVRDLMEAGMLSTIVEDIDTREDDFSFKSNLEGWVDNNTEWVHKDVKQAFKWATVSQDTGMYKFLNQTTQLSDFTARYIQYKHMTTRTENRLSRADAMREVQDNFVFYDIPTSPEIQWANDVGLFMFTKYYLRMQMPLLKLFRENPSRAIQMVLLQDLIGFATPVDSVLWSRGVSDWVNNPFANMFSAPAEILPLNGILHATGFD